MDERTKQILSIVVVVLLLVVEGYVLVKYVMEVRDLDAQNKTLETQRNTLQTTKVDRIDAAENQLAELSVDDEILRQIVPDDRQEYPFLDFVGDLQTETGVSIVVFGHTRRAATGRRRAVVSQVERHTWELEVYGTLEQFARVVNLIEYHGHNNDYMRFMTIDSFSISEGRAESGVLEIDLTVSAYSMPAIAG